MATYYQSWLDVEIGSTVFVEWPDSALMDPNDVALEPFKVTAKGEKSATIENADRDSIVITNLRALRRAD